MSGSSLRVHTTSGKEGIAACSDRKKRCFSKGSLMLRFSRKCIVSTRSLFRNSFSISCTAAQAVMGRLRTRMGGLAGWTRVRGGVRDGDGWQHMQFQSKKEERRVAW